MKTKLFSLLALLATLQISAQAITETFESFTLAPNSFYKDTNNAPFQSNAAVFTHEWVTGSFPFWSAGFSYSNAYDSATAGFTNLYGVMPYKGYNNSSMYVIGQDKGVIRLKNKQTVVNGFYYTNTTYAYKSMRYGDGFSRKFGDTTGTGSGTNIAQGNYPDYFKIIVRGYLNGNLKTDSVEIWLADYRFANGAQDFMVNDWRYANTSALGLVDSIQLSMRSSVFNQYGMLTPGFFAIDNFETGPENPVGLLSDIKRNQLNIFPVPFKNDFTIIAEGQFQWTLTNMQAEILMTGGSENLTKVETNDLPCGIYLLRIQKGTELLVRRIIKE